MKFLFTFFLFLGTVTGFSQEIPVWMQTVNNAPLTSDSIYSFPERKRLEDAIQMDEFSKKVSQIKEEMYRVAKEADSILNKVGLDTFNISLLSSQYIKFSTEISGDRKSLRIIYRRTIEEGAFSAELEFDFESYPNLKRLQDGGRLIILPLVIVGNPCCGTQVESLEAPEHNEGYASYLLGLIDRTLTTYPDKLGSVSYQSYINYEQSKGFSDINQKINFRIIFLKKCYAKL